MLQAIDKTERERIRQALRRYKDLRGIGDPYLCTLINSETGFAITQSTLQRFLRGKHRTSDTAIAVCQQFLQRVAPPEAEREFGKALSNFLAVLPQEADWQAAFAGAYRTRIRPYQPPLEPMKPGAVAMVGQVGARHLMRGPKFTPWSAVRLDMPPDASYLRARELLFDPELRRARSHLRMKELWRGAAGAFVPIGENDYLMFVRSFLDARVYHLSKQADDPLTLRGVVYQSAAVAFPDVTDRMPILEIEMTRDAQVAESDKPSA